MGGCPNVECKMYAPTVLDARPPKGGLRYNTGKLPLHLISPHALNGLAAVLEFGKKKYAARNWEKGLNYEETLGSALRHLLALLAGERIDPESGLPHIDHLQCNAMFLSHFMKQPEKYEKFDTLPKEP